MEFVQKSSEANVVSKFDMLKTEVCGIADRHNLTQDLVGEIKFVFLFTSWTDDYNAHADHEIQSIENILLCLASLCFIENVLLCMPNILLLLMEAIPDGHQTKITCLV